MSWGSIVRISFLFVGLAACGGNVDDGAATGGTGGGGKGGIGAGGRGGAVGGGGSGGAGTGGIGTGGTGAGGAPLTGCTLGLLASGSLPDPVAAGASLSGPGAVATDSGFVIGYRDQNGDTLRAVVVSVTDDGTIGSPSVFDLGGCAAQTPTDGVGLAYANGSGLLATSLPNCGKGAGAVFIPFDSKGTVGSASGPRNSAFVELTTSPSAIAPSTTPNEYDMLYRVETSSPPVIERVVLQGPGFKNLAIVHPFGEDDVPFAMVAATSQVRALLAPIASKSATVVQIGPNDGDTIKTAGEVTLPMASWAAISAWGDRVGAVVPATSGLAVIVASLGAGSLNVHANNVIGSGVVDGAAMTTVGDHLLVAAGTPGVITLHRVPGATTSLDVSQTALVLFANDSLYNLSNEFDGKRLAMTAARGRVLLTWLTREKLGTANETGGWALLQCAE